MIRQILGYVTIAIGIVALLVPLVPGGIIVFIGLEILGLTLLKNKINEWTNRRVNLQKNDTKNGINKLLL